MNCVICKNGDTRPGLVTVSLEREGAIIVFKNVPALVCRNCGDYYLDEQTTSLLLDKATQTTGKGVEFEIINFKPAA
jgi:YgiT-type zinc finger domain-containing protein